MATRKTGREKIRTTNGSGSEKKNFNGEKKALVISGNVCQDPSGQRRPSTRVQSPSGSVQVDRVVPGPEWCGQWRRVPLQINNKVGSASNKPLWSQIILNPGTLRMACRMAGMSRCCKAKMKSSTSSLIS